MVVLAGQHERRALDAGHVVVQRHLRHDGLQLGLGRRAGQEAEQSLVARRVLVHDEVLVAVGGLRSGRLQPVIGGDQAHRPVGAHAPAVGDDLGGINLPSLHEHVERRARGSLEVVPGQPDAAHVALPEPGPVEGEHVHAPLVHQVVGRVGGTLAGCVTARHVEEQGRFLGAGAEVQVAGHDLAVEGDLEPFDRVRAQVDDLVIAAPHAAVEEALLVVELENVVLGFDQVAGGAPEELQRAALVAIGPPRLGVGLFGEPLSPEMLADHRVAANALGECPAVARPPVVHATGLLDDVVENPLLVVAPQAGLTGPRGPRIRHLISLCGRVLMRSGPGAVLSLCGQVSVWSGLCVVRSPCGQVSVWSGRRLRPATRPRPW